MVGETDNREWYKYDAAALRNSLTIVESSIWASAYASAFVHTFKFYETHKGFDHPAEHITAEASMTIADLAVLKMREWAEQEKVVIP